MRSLGMLPVAARTPKPTHMHQSRIRSWSAFSFWFLFASSAPLSRLRADNTPFFLLFCCTGSHYCVWVAGNRLCVPFKTLEEQPCPDVQDEQTAVLQPRHMERRKAVCAVRATRESWYSPKNMLRNKWIQKNSDTEPERLKAVAKSEWDWKIETSVWVESIISA